MNSPLAIIHLEHVEWLELMGSDLKYQLLFDLNFGDSSQDLNINNFLASIGCFDQNFDIGSYSGQNELAMSLKWATKDKTSASLGFFFFFFFSTHRFLSFFLIFVFVFCFFLSFRFFSLLFPFLFFFFFFFLKKKKKRISLSLSLSLYIYITSFRLLNQTKKMRYHFYLLLELQNKKLLFFF
jgi:hypothetical protein